MITPHIGLNAHLLTFKQNYRSAGISWYIHNLLTQLAHVKSTYRYTAFLSEPKFRPISNLSVRYSGFSTINPLARMVWEQLLQPITLQREAVTLLHSMSFVAPIVNPCPSVLTIYDLSFKHYPDAFPMPTRVLLNQLTKISAQRAKAIIAISESTRQDIIRFYGVLPAKVHTIYCGVDSVFKPLPTAQVEAFKAKKGLPEQFIFRLGTIEPRKNVEGLVKAYARWQKRDKGIPKLIIGGGKGWYYQKIFKLVEDLELTDSIIFVGYLPQDELPLWYNAATFFVYPSWFEGFGLPIAESMACGTPVITSNVSSMPEVAGNAALQVDPADVEALSHNMQALFRRPKWRDSMREKGLQQASKFSWKQAAEETVGVYEQILASRAVNEGV